jgi:hypothetical protein
MGIANFEEVFKAEMLELDRSIAAVRGRDIVQLLGSLRFGRARPQ